VTRNIISMLQNINIGKIITKQVVRYKGLPEKKEKKPRCSNKCSADIHNGN